MRSALGPGALVLTVLLVLPSPALSEGTSGFEFLRVGMAARTAAMGGASTALAEGAEALSSNPAGLVSILDSEALAAYLRYPEDVQGGQVLLGRSVPSGWRLAIGVRYLSYGSMARTTATHPTGQNSGDFSASDLALDLGAARALTAGIRLGVAATYVSGSIDSYHASGVGLTLGATADLPVRNLSLGIAVRNFGLYGSSYLDGEMDLPAEGQVGIGYCSPAARAELDLAADREGDLGVAAGAEILVGRALWLRAGMDDRRWNLGRSSAGWGSLSAFSWGLGIAVDQWGLDYAVHPFGEMGTVHRLTLRSIL